jgi:hypothetical protein
MWERTLQDLIRGLRANKKDESKFIAKAVDEIRNEIKSDDMELKAGAVLKLTYVSCVLPNGTPVSLIRVSMLARHVGLRYGLGVIPCRRGYVFLKASSEECRLPRCSAVIRPRHGRIDADYKSIEEG